MFLLLLLCLGLTNISGQPCEDKNSVDISDGKSFHDGTIVKDGVNFPPKYMFTKNVSGEIKTFGCICKIKRCFRKCCPLGSVMYGKNCTSMPELDLLSQYGLNTSFYNAFRETIDLKTSQRFGLVYGRPCPAVYMEDDGEEYIQEDGKLYIQLQQKINPWLIRDPDQYCMDTFVIPDYDGHQTVKLDALVCFPETRDDDDFIPSVTCMLLSCVFILATVAVYAWLPELRNLHGRVLMAYLICLFFGFFFLATMKILLLLNKIDVLTCVVFTFIIYYALEAGFFWLNVMSFDIWWTFSGKRGLSLEKLTTRARFKAYAMYAFGFPTALTLLLISLEFSGLPYHPLLPTLRGSYCFITGTSKLLYLYGPITILCIANMVFFVLTAVKIAQIKKQTAVLKSNESSTHDPHRKDKQRLWLYVKLFMVMGVNWILEVISSLDPNAGSNFIWRYTDAYNVLIGVFIFIMFVCKRKIFRLIKKRIKAKYDGSTSVMGDMKHFSQTNDNRHKSQRVSVETVKSTLGPEHRSSTSASTKQTSI